MPEPRRTTRRGFLKSGSVLGGFLALDTIPAAGSEVNWGEESANLNQSSSNLSSDWSYPRYGPEQTAVSSGANPPTDGSLRVGRSLSIEGELQSSPVVKDGVVYVFSKKNDTGHLNAYDLGGGQQSWRKSFTSDEPSNDYMRNLCVNGSTVCLSDGDSIFAFDAGSGNQLWRFTSDDPYGGTSATLVGDRVYGFARGRFLVALDATNGDELWATANHGRGRYGSHWVPSPPAVSEGMVYYAWDDAVAALNTSSGSVKWKYETEGFITSPTFVGVSGDLLLVAGSHVAEVFEVTSGSQLWSNRDSIVGAAIDQDNVFLGLESKVVCLDAQSGSRKWTAEEPAYTGAPSVANGIVYSAQRGQGFVGVDRANGDVRLSLSADDAPRFQTKYNPVLSGDSILVPANDGIRILQKDNQKPSASFSYSPTAPRVGDEVTLDASGSSDPDGDIKSYEWRVDGSPAATGDTVIFAFENSGNVDVTLSVTDNTGATASTTRTLVVEEKQTETQADTPTDTSGNGGSAGSGGADSSGGSSRSSSESDTRKTTPTRAPEQSDEEAADNGGSSGAGDSSAGGGLTTTTIGSARGGGSGRTSTTLSSGDGSGWSTTLGGDGPWEELFGVSIIIAALSAVAAATARHESKSEKNRGGRP